MTKLFATAALLALATPALAAELPDYTDRTEYTCDKDTIKEQMIDMVANSPSGKRGITVIYIKGEPVETSRKTNELRCRITAVLNVGLAQTGIFRWVNQDGQALLGFEPGKTK